MRVLGAVPRAFEADILRLGSVNCIRLRMVFKYDLIFINVRLFCKGLFNRCAVIFSIVHACERRDNAKVAFCCTLQNVCIIFVQ